MTHSTSLRALLLAAAALPAMTTAGAQSEPATGDDTQVEEIIVTARKVSEDQQKIPIPLTALTSKQLEVARTPTVESISGLVPNVRVFKALGNSNAYAVFIRGIGRDNNGFNVEAPVALYVDDVIYPYQVGPVLDLGGIDRVEVLRGPQGTLYGRNATVGAIKYVTTRPDLDEMDASAALTYGTFERAEALGSISIPIVEGKVALKLDAGYHYYDGYMFDQVFRHNVNGTNGGSIRGSLLWKPSENTEIFVSADATRARDELSLGSPVIVVGTTVTPRFGTYETSHAAPDINDLDSSGFTIQGKVDLENVTLRSITAVRSFDQNYAQDSASRSDVAFSGSVFAVDDTTVTQEFQATGTLFEGRLKYVAGLFFLDSNTTQKADQPGGATLPSWFVKQEATSVAAYLDGTFEIGGGVSIGGGIRYTKDTKDIFQSLSSLTANFSKSASDEWEAVSPRIGIDWQVTDDILLYASWAKGFKGGALNSTQPTTIGLAGVFVPPEYNANTEIGLKSKWLGGKLRVNANYFWSEYTDQTQALTVFVGGIASSALVFSDAHMDGLELEIQARPIPELRLSATIGTLNAELLNVPPGHPVYLLDNRLPKHSPKLTYNLKAEYDIDSFLGGSLTLGGEYNWSDGYWSSLAQGIGTYQDAFDVTNLYASYTLPDDRYQIIVQGTNVTDTKYFKLASAGFRTQFYAPPAEVSVTLKFRM